MCGPASHGRMLFQYRSNCPSLRNHRLRLSLLKME
jgi:hypothetical protein